MDDKLGELEAHLDASAATLIATKARRLDELTLTTSADRLIGLLAFLRDDPKCQFRQLIDVCGVDHPERPARFEVV